jgi:malate synthase
LQDKSKKAAQNDPELNQQYRWFDSIKDLENQIKQEEETLALHRMLQTTMDSYREKILGAVKGKWDYMSLIKTTANFIMKTQSEQKDKTPVMDREFCDKVLSQENFVKV